MRERFEGELSTSLSPRGDLAAVHGVFTQGGPGFVVYKIPEIRRLWRHNFGGSWDSTDVFIGGQPSLLTAVAYDGNQKGNLQAFNAQGQRLWTRPVDGRANIITSRDGQRIIMISPVARKIRLISRDNEVLAELPISPDATAQFIGGQNFVLVNDSDRVQLLDSSGREIWSHKMDREFKRSVALSGDTKYIAITSRGSDSSVYVFDNQGKSLWSRQLLLGGANQPVFSADSKVLYVYNVGAEAAVYALEAATGKLLWRTVFDPNVKKAYSTGFWPGKDKIVWDYVVPGADGINNHWLVMQNQKGEELQKVYLGRNVTVQGSMDGRYLVTTENSPSGNIRATTVRLFDLTTAKPMEG